jgi:hypothetical protein
VLDKTIEPDSVRAYLTKPGDRLGEVRRRWRPSLACSRPSCAQAFALYEGLLGRPRAAGWGQKGTLDISTIREMARPPRKPKR